MKKIAFLILFFTIYHNFSYSQKVDSLIKIQAPYFRELKYHDSLSILNHKPNNFEKYRTKFFNSEFQTLGVTGNISNSLYWNPNENEFNYSFHNFNSLIYKEKDLEFYQLASPYSDVDYVSMGKNDNIVRARYARNIAKGLNVSLNFRVISNVGAYLRQNAENRNFSLNLNYKRKSSHYAMETFGIYNKLTIQQNGGIAIDSIFENNEEKSREQYAIRLKNANNSLKQYHIYSAHYYRIGKLDSNAISGKHIDELFRVGAGISFYKSNFKYQSFNDTIDKFYKNSYFDKNNTFDSTYLEQPSAFFIIKTPWFESNADRVLASSITVSYNQALYKPKKQASAILEYYKINAGVYSNVYKTFSGLVEAEYNVGDYYNNDYTINAGIRYNISLDKDEEAWVKAILTMKEEKSPYYQVYNISNHFKWDVDSLFTKQKYQIASINSRFYGFDMNVNFNKVHNYVYYDENALPKQSKNDIVIIQANIKKNLKITKWLFFDADLSFQKVDGNDSLQLPQIISWTSLYTDFFMFKRAIQIQVGVDATYYSAYYAPAYMPATAQFYYQNEEKYGNYPFVDVFVNAKVQRATFFAKMEHVNKGFMGYNYYNTPHYPARDRIFKFGICWRFFD